MPASNRRSRAAAAPGTRECGTTLADVVVGAEAALYRDALATLLETSSCLHVVGTVDLTDLAATLGTTSATLLVADASWRGPATRLSAIQAVCVEPGIDVVAVVGDEDDVVCCAGAGVSGIALRAAPGRELVATVEQVARGAKACSPEVVSILLERVAALARATSAMPIELSPREREILALLERGLSNKEIAVRLSIALPTVKNHIHRLLRKLGVQRRGEAAAAARSVAR